MPLCELSLIYHMNVSDRRMDRRTTSSIWECIQCAMCGKLLVGRWLRTADRVWSHLLLNKAETKGCGKDYAKYAN